MGRFTLGAAAVGGAAIAFTAAFGSGVAAADDPLVGKPYSDASSAISGWGGTAVVSTVVGGRAERDDCIVTNWRKDTNDNSKYLVSLNCNAAVASASEPGNSAATPQGRLAQEKQAKVQWRSENPEWCAQALAEHPDWGYLDGCDYSAG